MSLGSIPLARGEEAEEGPHQEGAEEKRARCVPLAYIGVSPNWPFKPDHYRY